ncbi:MAG: response regulator receiver [Puniceicoccaceae bacterium 5H]|nr:MAG: response regulator receiver [Puniceicoccaceae bacterium 5H]
MPVAATDPRRASPIEAQAQTVLIVDDVPTNLALLEDFLSAHGYDVIIAESGSSALKRVQFRRPDIILLDIMMPGISGFETCEQLKADPQTRDIPVIFMTALDETTNKVRGFQMGAVDYITKPLDAEEVLARLRTHLTLRQLQLDLQHEVEAKNQAISDLDAYAHTVAHDLKGPLNNMSGFAQILERDAQKMPMEKLQDFCGIIYQSSIRMSNIINELLLLASVRDEDVPVQPVPMKACFDEAMRRLASTVENSQAEFELPQSWPLCTGYGPWLEEVWVNFISNAVKYGGNPPHIRIVAEQRHEQTVYYAIEDNGPGVNAEMQDRLFKPFQRLERVRAQGHGLGLSIVKRIIEKLGGSVGVEPATPQGGTRFYFLLPSANFSPTP